MARVAVQFNFDSIDEAAEFFAKYKAEGQDVQFTRENQVNVVPAWDTPRANVSPGPSSITKMGAETKHNVLNAIAKGTIDVAKFGEHAKLLWSRGECKYDGKDYY